MSQKTNTNNAAAAKTAQYIPIPLSQDIGFLFGFTAHEVIVRRMSLPENGAPRHGKGYKAARRCAAIVELLFKQQSWGHPQFDALLVASKELLPRSAFR